MSDIDRKIIATSQCISENISSLSAEQRGLLSQNILANLRNFVESIAVKVYSEQNKIDDLKEYEQIKHALNSIAKNGSLKFLNRFHRLLQQSVSHYTIDKDGSERLILKYYEYLLRIKIYLKKTYDLDVLENITDFPLNTDTELNDYYTKIAEKIDYPSSLGNRLSYDDRYYIHKIKPFFINGKIYYEVTFSPAMSNFSKFDRLIAFTCCEILENYSVKFSIHSDTIQVLGKSMSIMIIDEFEISIRPCELQNFSQILGINVECSTNSVEYKRLMRFIKDTNLTLTELVTSDQNYYDIAKNKILTNNQAPVIYNLLDFCRNIILKEGKGANVLRYLLNKMRNKVIKLQYDKEPCGGLSNLYLKYSCIPFDQMPYCTSLVQHNPKICDIIDSIPMDSHEHELFARHIKNNAELRGKVFTSKCEIKGFNNITKLMDAYNSRLYYKHNERRLEEFKGHIYLKGYARDCSEIIKILRELSSKGIEQYSSSVQSWLSHNAYIIDDETKKDALLQMFNDSHVGLIYGSAGTGKSTLINHIAHFFSDKSKLFIANTHPAVDNMRKKITANNCRYSTISKFLSKGNSNTSSDILFIDECSTVSNRDMINILNKAEFKLLVLVGDIYQIESISFGNWFSIAQKFVPKHSVFELSHPYRATNKKLIEVWKQVRNLDVSVLETLVKSGCVSRFDDSVFVRSSKDEIILCLNYDGAYGINNINRFLQNSNPNKGIFWGTNLYKIDDPILFNESNIFSPLIHNNTKGKIVGINSAEHKICFDIELDESINEMDALKYNFRLIGRSPTGNSIISFEVNKYRNTDEDDDNDNSTIVPFQVAYAISIHKAQGLEYDSVKIIITNEVEEHITHNIFYTAITRAKKLLKIYWSPETEKYVLDHFELKNPSKDAALISCMYDMALAH